MTALGCLFLAGKVEETPKKCKDITAIAEECFPEMFKTKPRLVVSAGEVRFMTFFKKMSHSLWEKGMRRLNRAFGRSKRCISTLSIHP